MAENDTLPMTGTALVYGNVGGSPATVLGDIDEITELPSLVAKEYDKTRVNSTSGFNQSHPDNSDPGWLRVKLAFEKAKIATAYSIYKVNKAWKITFVDGSTLVFDGRIQELKPEGAKGDEVVWALGIRVNTVHTFTPAV